MCVYVSVSGGSQCVGWGLKLGAPWFINLLYQGLGQLTMVLFAHTVQP